MINAIRTIDQLCYQSDVHANALDLSTNHEGVIVFTPENGVKQLLPGNAIGAFGYHMQPQSFPNQDALAIKKKLIINNQMGAQIQLTCDVLYNGQRKHSDRLITIPPNGLAVSFMEVDDGKILVVTTRPD